MAQTFLKLIKETEPQNQTSMSIPGRIQRKKNHSETIENQRHRRAQSQSNKIHISFKEATVKLISDL